MPEQLTVPHFAACSIRLLQADRECRSFSAATMIRFFHLSDGAPTYEF
jgi:hypothetical protein